MPKKLFVNRYELGRQLGEGGMGTVYRATDRLTGEVVALKQLNPRARRAKARGNSTDSRVSLAREFQVLSGLRHPNIINELDYGFDDEKRPYFTMEYLRGSRTIVQASRNLTLEKKVDLLIQLLQALAYLHQRGILHLDLKPGNVLVDQGQVRVLDFGVAVDSEEARGVSGTLAYMAPEVLKEQPATKAADLFAVGVIAYEIFAGQHPFNLTSMGALIKDIFGKDPDMSTLTQSFYLHRSTGKKEKASTEPPATLPPARDAGLEETVQIGIREGLSKEANPAVMPTLVESPLSPEERIELATTITDAEFTTSTNEGLAREAWRAEMSSEDVNHGDIINQRTLDAAISAHSHSLTPELITQEMQTVEEHPLAAVIAKLLSKDPAERYREARDVIGDLCAAIDLSIPEETRAIRESFLRGASFVGRQPELKQLQQTLQATVEGRGGAWLVGGGSGIGKSRLLEELRIQALVKGALVLRGYSLSGSGLPYQVWREPLRRLVLSTELTDLEAGVLKALVPDISALLGRHVPDVTLLEGKVGHQQLLDKIISVFRRQTQPILLILEDIHWESESLSFIRRLSALAPDLKLMIVCSYCDDVRPDLPVYLPNVPLLRLTPLENELVEMLSVSMLGPAGNRAELLALLKREGHANPFMLVELICALAEQVGHLDELAAAALPQTVFPNGVSDLVKWRLGRAPQWAQRYLNLAAVGGVSVDLEVMWHLFHPQDEVPSPQNPASPIDLFATDEVVPTEKDEEILSSNLYDLSAGGTLDDWLTICSNAILLERFDNDWRFIHDQIREGILQQIPPSELPAMHRRIAEAYEAAYPDRPAYAAILQRHWHAAGNFEKERHYATIAGRQAMLTGASAEGIAFFRRALELTPEGGHDEQRALLYARLGDLSRFVGNFDAAFQHYEAALKLAQSIDAPAICAAIWYGLGWAAYERGLYNTAAKNITESIAFYQKNGDRRGEGQALGRLGSAYRKMGKMDEALRYYEQALVIAREVGDALNEGLHLADMGNIYSQTGNLSEAIQRLRESIQIVERRSRRFSSFTRIKLAWALLQGDDTATARAEFERAAYAEIPEAKPYALAGWGVASLTAGDNAAAESAFRAALETGQALLVDQPELVETWYTLGLARTGLFLLGLAALEPAVEAYQKARELGPDALGRLEEARRNLDLLARLDPAEIEVVKHTLE